MNFYTLPVLGAFINGIFLVNKKIEGLITKELPQVNIICHKLKIAPDMNCQQPVKKVLNQIPIWSIYAASC